MAARWKQSHRPDTRMRGEDVSILLSLRVIGTAPIRVEQSVNCVSNCLQLEEKRFHSVMKLFSRG